jgi:hypothetical protein
MAGYPEEVVTEMRRLLCDVRMCRVERNFLLHCQLSRETCELPVGSHFWAVRHSSCREYHPLDYLNHSSSRHSYAAAPCRFYAFPNSNYKLRLVNRDEAARLDAFKFKPVVNPVSFAQPLRSLKGTPSTINTL